MTPVFLWHDCCRLVITFFYEIELAKLLGEDSSSLVRSKKVFAGSEIKIVLIFGIRDLNSG